ncbi:hypothetical protein EYF80_041028 [Liparis tanakae]|uniref:Uncharacterized protein n=1 Tax=Liparis tanakae TaxID=230148 RepID=A0A4Z2G5I4_9TELE|nr:hypothetical protein EYF80_041028 [Liparis tanakae]
MRRDVGSTLSPVPSCRTVWWVEFEGGEGARSTGLQSERARGSGGGGAGRRGLISQQHPPDEGLTLVPGVSFTLAFSPPPAVAPGPILFLISAAMVIKACSTLVAFLALVSKKGMAREGYGAMQIGVAATLGRIGGVGGDPL